MLHRPYTLLLLEDNLDDEALALRAFRESGLPLCVRVARDGACALRTLGLEGTGATTRPPDLVVSDYKMPKIDGPEILRRVRADGRLGRVPFVMLSSSDEAEGIARCRTLGASDYLVKPVGFESFLDCVRQIPRRWLGTSLE